MASTTATLAAASETSVSGTWEDPVQPADATAQVGSAVPAAPTGLTAAPTAVDALSVSWAASPTAESVTSYEVAVTSAVAGALLPPNQTVAAPTTTASVTGLSPGTACTVSVTATNALGTGPAASVDVTTSQAAAPSAPSVTPGAEPPRVRHSRVDRCRARQRVQPGDRLRRRGHATHR